MPYWDLLNDCRLFDRFLKYFNSYYSSNGQSKYGSLIKRYYCVTDLNPCKLPSDLSNHIRNLISDDQHCSEIYDSLRDEFGMGKRSAKLVPKHQFANSLHLHIQLIQNLAVYKMESISETSVPPDLFDHLKELFTGLEVVPSTQKTKLVAVSKTMHFLLPDLVMPIDNASVLKFMGKENIQKDINKQFDLFKHVFIGYLNLKSKFNLTSSNGSGNWWNISVPKRIDNAIAGFWQIFSSKNIETVICNNIGQLLTQLNIP